MARRWRTVRTWVSLVITRSRLPRVRARASSCAAPAGWTSTRPITSSIRSDCLRKQQSAHGCRARCLQEVERVEGSMMSTAPLLEVVDIHKRFTGVYALRGVSLSFQRGQIYHLLGENGCGKSTLIKIISGAQPPEH